MGRRRMVVCRARVLHTFRVTTECEFDSRSPRLCFGHRSYYSLAALAQSAQSVALKKRRAPVQFWQAAPWVRGVTGRYARAAFRSLWSQTVEVRLLSRPLY